VIRIAWLATQHYTAEIAYALRDACNRTCVAMVIMGAVVAVLGLSALTLVGGK
jgi:hypothetical protein